MTNTKPLRSRVKLTFHARFCRPAGWVTALLSLTPLLLNGLYHQTKRHQQALPLIQEAIATYIPTLGAEHPTTQSAQSWLQAIQQATSAKTENKFRFDLGQLRTRY